MESLLRRDLIKTIERYQYSIQHVNPPERDPQRVLHYLRKLSKLPIKLEELEKTGIGKTVNALRKYQGTIGDEAGLLVGKWKAIAKIQVQEEEECESHKRNDADSHSDYESPSNEYNYNVSKSSTSVEFEIDKVRPVKSIQEITLKPFKEKVRSSQDPINDRKRNHSFDKSKPERKEKYVKLNSGNGSEDENYPNERREKKEFVCKASQEDNMMRMERERKHHKSSKRTDDRSHRGHDSGRHSYLKMKYDSEKHRDRIDTKTDSLNKAHNSEKYGSKSSSKYLINRSSASPINDYGSDSDDYYDDDDEDSPINSNDEDFGAALLGISQAVSPVKKKSTPTKYSSSIPSSPGTNSPRNSGSDFDTLSSGIKMEPLDEIDLDELEDESYRSKDISLGKRKSLRLKDISEDEALKSMTTTKNHKTKVFSGCKSKVVTIKCPTLFELCTRVLQDHFDCLEYTGGVPYDVLRPVLEKVTAEQLYTFENYNPYLIGETDELWEYHCARHFRRAKRLEYETWRDLYLRCVEERDEKLQTLTENISQSIANSTPVRKTKLAYLGSHVKPPRNIAKNQVKNGTAHVTVKRSPKGPQPSPAAVQSVKERLAQQSLAAPQAVTVSPRNPLSSLKKKKAPLMMKSLQLLRGLKR